MTKGDDVAGLTLDAGALLALERGDARVRALLRRASEVGAALDVPAGVVARAVSMQVGARPPSPGFGRTSKRC